MDWTLTDAYKWTHNGDEVLIVKCVEKDGTSYNGFRWPLEVGASVEALDWNPEPVCGGGLHGWPWGLAWGDGKDPGYGGTWLVFGAKPDETVSLNGKVKARRGTIRYVGSWDGALGFVIAGQMELVHRSSSGAATASGRSGAATASGESGAATASGRYGAATASGWSGAATASGECGEATASGEALSAVVTGLGGKARAPMYGVIALAWWNAKSERVEMRCSRVGGRGGLKPDTWYRLDDGGKFVEAS